MADDATAEGIWSRTTAPQSPYTLRQVVLGLAIFATGLLVTFVLPLVFA